jgi:tetratricopeptide (TPR) repeat protein
MFVKRLSLLCFVTLLAVWPVVSVADSLSGAYLAGRHASYFSDYREAARYYTQALARDRNNLGLMENAMSAHLSLVDFDRAVPVARLLQSRTDQSQIANMTMMAHAIQNEAYDQVVSDLTNGRSVGPLVDGLAMAWAQLGRGQMSDALSSFDDLSASEGLRAFGTYHKALALASVGDLEGALDIFDGGGAAGLQNTRRGTIARVEVLSQLERNEDAVTLIDAAFGTELDPEMTQLRRRLAAGEPLPLTMITSPRDGLAEMFYNVADVLQGEADEAYILLYSRIAEMLRPDHIDTLLLSANVLEDLERYELATESYNRVPRDHPAFHAAELGRAEALRKADKSDAALEVLGQLAKSHGNLPVVHITTGHTLRQLKRYRESSEAYDRALALYPDTDRSQWFLYYSRGITFERLDEFDKAEADFRYALELNPGQPQVLNYLGYSLVEKQIKLDEALEMIQMAVKAEPESGYIVDSLGWVLYRLGRYEEAVGHMERAAELMPVDPIVNDHLGDVYWSVGRTVEAQFQWHRALSFDPEEKDADRIRRKLDVGLDQVLEEEGAKPLM